MNRLSLLLLVLGLLCGWKVHTWYDGYSNEKAQTKAIQVVAHANIRTQNRTVAAATHVQAIAAGGAAVDQRTANTHFVAPVPGDRHAPASAAACVPLLLSDPLASPDFRLQWDAGSDPAAHAGEAHDVSAAGP